VVCEIINATEMALEGGVFTINKDIAEEKYYTRETENPKNEAEPS
jgi:hypothetical protein